MKKTVKTTYIVTALDNCKNPNYIECGHKHKSLLSAVKCGLDLSTQGRFYHWGVLANGQLVESDILDIALCQAQSN
jgi:hypothetical protein